MGNQTAGREAALACERTITDPSWKSSCDLVITSSSLKASALLWYFLCHSVCQWQSIASWQSLYMLSFTFLFFFYSFYTFFFHFYSYQRDGRLISPLSSLPPASLLWVGAIKVPSLIMPSSGSNVFLLEKWIELRWSMSYNESQRHS